MNNRSIIYLLVVFILHQDYYHSVFTRAFILNPPSKKTQTPLIKLSQKSKALNYHEANTSDGGERPRIVIVGGGLGGVASAYDAEHILRHTHDVIVVSDKTEFSFVPSNPWVAIKKRQPKDIQVSLDKVLPRHGVQFRHDAAVALEPASNLLKLASGEELTYDYLLIATGPRLAFDAVEGLSEFGASICKTDHAAHTAELVDKLVEDPGPCVIGAVQGSSCFGPAYEFLFLLQYELLRRGGKELLEQCPFTFITPEPVVGHLGLDGSGDSKAILKDLCKKKHVQVMCQVRTTKVTKDSVTVERLGDDGKVVETKELPSKLTMMIPPFHGLDCWKNVPGLTDEKGLILVDEHQQSKTYPNIFAVGVAVSMPQIFETVIPVGIPKTGYLIESQGTAAVRNIKTLSDWTKRHNGSQEKDNNALPPILTSHSLNNAVCITDFGNDGAIFVALPQVPPRRHDWTIHSKMATLAKIAFEKYFLHKVDHGDTEPYYEKYLLKLIGVERTEEDHKVRGDAGLH